MTRIQRLLDLQALGLVDLVLGTAYNIMGQERLASYDRPDHVALPLHP